MRTIDLIREKVLAGEYEFAIPHFFEEMVNDNLDLIDIETAIANGRIRRRFTKDVRGTRYEIVGSTPDERQIGIISRINGNGKVLFITTYAIE